MKKCKYPTQIENDFNHAQIQKARALLSQPLKKIHSSLCELLAEHRNSDLTCILRHMLDSPISETTVSIIGWFFVNSLVPVPVAFLFLKMMISQLVTTNEGFRLNHLFARAVFPRLPKYGSYCKALLTNPQLQYYDNELFISIQQLAHEPVSLDYFDTRIHIVMPKTEAYFSPLNHIDPPLPLPSQEPLLQMKQNLFNSIEFARTLPADQQRLYCVNICLTYPPTSVRIRFPPFLSAICSYLQLLLYDSRRISWEAFEVHPQLERMGSWIGALTVSQGRPPPLYMLNIPLLLRESVKNGTFGHALVFLHAFYSKVAALYQPPNPVTNLVLEILAAVRRKNGIRTDIIERIEKFGDLLKVDVNLFFNRSIIVPVNSFDRCSQFSSDGTNTTTAFLPASQLPSSANANYNYSYNYNTNSNSSSISNSNYNYISDSNSLNNNNGYNYGYSFSNDSSNTSKLQNADSNSSSNNVDISYCINSYFHYVPNHGMLPPEQQLVFNGAQRIEKYYFVESCSSSHAMNALKQDDSSNSNNNSSTSEQEMLQCVVSLATADSPILAKTSSRLFKKVTKGMPPLDLAPIFRCAFPNKYILSACLHRHCFAPADINSLFSELLTNPFTMPTAKPLILEFMPICMELCPDYSFASVRELANIAPRRKANAVLPMPSAAHIPLLKAFLYFSRSYDDSYRSEFTAKMSNASVNHIISLISFVFCATVKRNSPKTANAVDYSAIDSLCFALGKCAGRIDNGTLTSNCFQAIENIAPSAIEHQPKALFRLINGLFGFLHFRSKVRMIELLEFLSPSRFPSFTLCWMQLVMHRAAFPNLVRTNETKPMQFCLNFVATCLKLCVEYPDVLYRGVARILITISGCFPLFFISYHALLLECLPLRYVQFRNIILGSTVTDSVYPPVGFKYDETLRAKAVIAVLDPILQTKNKKNQNNSNNNNINKNNNSKNVNNNNNDEGLDGTIIDISTNSNAYFITSIFKRAIAEVSTGVIPRVIWQFVFYCVAKSAEMNGDDDESFSFPNLPVVNLFSAILASFSANTTAAPPPEQITQTNTINSNNINNTNNTNSTNNSNNNNNSTNGSINLNNINGINNNNNSYTNIANSPTASVSSNGAFCSAAPILDAIIDQLRYPNNHTSFASGLLFALFEKGDSNIRELIVVCLIKRMMCVTSPPQSVRSIYKNITMKFGNEVKAFLQENKEMDAFRAAEAIIINSGIKRSSSGRIIVHRESNS